MSETTSNTHTLTYQDWQQVSIWISMLGRCVLPNTGTMMRYIRAADCIQREMDLLSEAYKRIEGATSDEGEAERRDKIMELLEQKATLIFDPLQVEDVVSAKMIASADSPAVDESVKMAGNIMLMYRLGIVAGLA